MYPMPTGSAAFSADQTTVYEATYWDTTATVPQAGLSIALFDVLDPTLDLLAAPYADRDTLEAVFDGPRLRSVLGRSDDGYRAGREPTLIKYWGSGAPVGGKVARRVALKYSGTVVTPEAAPADAAYPVTLIFAGQGKLRVFQNDAEVGAGRLREPVVNGALTSRATIERNGGYLIVEATVRRGDTFDLYFVQNGEAWGGLVGKVLPGHGHAIDFPTFRAALLRASVIGAGFLSTGAPPAVTVPYIEEITVERRRRQIPSASVTVALTTETEPEGYVPAHVGGQYTLVDAQAPTRVLRPGRLIAIAGGFRTTPDGTEEVYPRFTGTVESITPDASGLTATIQCRGFEGKLEVVADENLPDLLSYVGNGFIDREWQGYPVFGAGAWDAWPLDVAVAEMTARAAIDAHALGRSPLDANAPHGRYRYRTATTDRLVTGAPRFACRSLATPEEYVYLQRSTNYGNLGPLRKDYLPPDDAYRFPARLSERLYDRVTEVTENFGYDFSFDAEGQATLASRNNPTTWSYLSAPESPTERYTPSAIGGRYEHAVVGAGQSAWTRSFVVQAARVDLYVGLGVEDGTARNGAAFQSTVEVRLPDGTWAPLPEVTQTHTTYLASAPEAFFYEDLLRADGTNAAVLPLFALPFDEYRVTLTALGPDLRDPNTTAVLRLNGLAVFERDPSRSPLPQALSTLGNLLDLKPISNEKDLINHVIAIGQRRTAVTDSDKYVEENPNNPLTEFNVSVAADPWSIYDPDAPNFVGGKRTTVLVDETVPDGDFAKWLARTLLFRQNRPNLSASGTHTVLPMLEINDPLRIEAARDAAFEHTLWVEGFRERWTLTGADVDLDVTAYPELPSYTPRDDVDLALFNDSPVYRVATSYRNLYGQPVRNVALPAAGLARMTRNDAVVTVATSAASFTLPSGVSPDDLAFQRDVGERVETLVNHPYRRFWTLAATPAAGASTYTLTVDVQEGDGTPGVYDAAKYSFPQGWRLSADQWAVRPLQGAADAASANPFYDPYTSEVGNLVTARFDTLVSGFYRVSLWAISERGGYTFPVAWLTRPEANADDEDAHWLYYDAGAARELLWDGVDNIGLWNAYQSADLSRTLAGTFGDKPLLVRRGFYAWNDQGTALQTQIGDEGVAANYGPDGLPFFTKGRYTRLYLKVEARSDRLLRTEGARRAFTFNSHDDTKAIVPAPFYVFTHLGEPTQSHLTVEDWDEVAGGAWTEATETAHWTPTVGDAAIRNGKPVRVTFQPVPRRGVLFYGEDGVTPDPTKTAVQLSRTAHCKVNVFDQVWSFSGKPWESDKLHKDNRADNNRYNREAKRLTSRSMSDDTHTVSFESSSWLTGRDLQFLEWVFQPSMFEKEFGGVREAIRYGDYEQLYTLPGFDTKQGGGTARADKAFLNYAFLNYLFYLSAHTLDRSGRRQHCINPAFVDASKIVTPAMRAPSPAQRAAYGLRYERLGADTYLVRSIITRQWVEPTWLAPGLDGKYLPGSPVDPAHPGTHGIPDAWQRQWVQPVVTDLEPLTTPLATGGAEDTWVTAYTTNDSTANRIYWHAWISGGSGQAGPTMKAHPHQYAIPAFGAWDFNRYLYPNYYTPSPIRDLRPFWKAGMPDWACDHPRLARDGVEYATQIGQDILTIPSGHYASALRDLAGQANWFGFAYADSFVPQREHYRGARIEVDVLEWAAQNPREAEIGYVFDYVRQDALNRFDHFRGVIGRAPFARRQDFTIQEDASWWTADDDRQAGTQAVTPSGSYLLNLGNYDDYLIAPATRAQHAEAQSFLHFTHDINDFWDIRFRHEFAWYSARYFPVAQNGGARYGTFKVEYRTDGTLAGYGAAPLFDFGAWTGWKDDRTETQWATDPHLRWGELFGSSEELRAGAVLSDGSITKPFLTGGYGSGGVAEPTGPAQYLKVLMGQRVPKWVRRANIFADTHPSQRQRLAVGPRVPETRSLVLNLTLPDRLRK